MSNKQAEISSATRHVVDSLTSAGFMFTALDVSNEVKQRLEGVRHRDVSPVVRALFEDGSMGADYTRTTIDVMAEGKKVQALLYHDKRDDPDDYDGSLRRQTAAPPKRTAASPSPKAAPGPAATPAALSNEIALRIDAEGRAAVPRAFLVRAGLTDATVFLDGAQAGSGLTLTRPSHGVDPLIELEYDGDVILIPSRYLAAFDPKAPLVARLGIGAVDVEGRVR